MTSSSSLMLRLRIALLVLLVATGRLLAGDAPAVAEFFLLELPPSAEGLPPKSIIRINAGELSLIAPGTLVDASGNKSNHTACLIMKIESDQDGVVTCTVGDVGKIVLDRKAKTVLLPMIDGAKPLIAQTPIQAAEQVGITWITSKQAFVAKARKGDDIMGYLLGPSIGLEDHYNVTLWDGTRLNIYAPEERIDSVYVRSEGKGATEWLIQGDD